MNHFAIESTSPPQRRREPAATAPLRQRRALLGAVVGGLFLPAGAGWAQGRAPALALAFRGREFLHRWSRQGQHEFTPSTDADLSSWRDMITLNVHAAVTNGEQLATVANQVLGNYQQHGRILQTRSKPRTGKEPAEHLIVAVLGDARRLEAAFARCVLHEGVGVVAVVGHRAYGPAAADEIRPWLGAQGAPVEAALNALALPAVARLKALG